MSLAPAAAQLLAEALPTADFFHFESLLGPAERSKLASSGVPGRGDRTHATDWWNNAHFPAHILPNLAASEPNKPVERGAQSPVAGAADRRNQPRSTRPSPLSSWSTTTSSVESLDAFGSLAADVPAARRTCRFFPRWVCLRSTEPGHDFDVAGGMVPGGYGAFGGRPDIGRLRRNMMGARVRRTLEGHGDVRRRPAGVVLPRGGRCCARFHRGRGTARRVSRSRDRTQNRSAASSRTPTPSSRMSVSPRPTVSAVIKGSRGEHGTQLKGGSWLTVAWQALGAAVAAFDVAAEVRRRTRGSSAGRW